MASPARFERAAFRLVVRRNELAILPGSRCTLHLQGVHPFYSWKYDITKHPMYPLLADADEGNRFEVGRY